MWDELYNQHYLELLRYCLAACEDRQIAEDLAQEVFLKALQHGDLFEDLGPKQRRAWLFRALKNLICDRYRRYVLESRYIQANPPDESSLDPGIQELENGMLLQKLDPEDQKLFTLRFMEGYTAAEIGEMLNIPAGTVRSRLSRCRKRLKTMIEI